jgi:hypothetical protein
VADFLSPTGEVLPGAVAADNGGNAFYVTSQGTISKIAPDGTTTTVATVTTPNSVFVGLLPDNQGNLFAVNGHQIVKIAANGAMTPFAGNGTAGYSGDGGPALQAEFSVPCSMALGKDGTLYFADGPNNAIRSVTPDGNIHTIAGTGKAGDLGDGEPATSAQLSAPVSIALDSTGNLYIADEGNNRARVIGTDGIIRAFAGNGSYGFSGDGLPATLATFAVVAGVAVDASDAVYVADLFTVRKVVNATFP